jgi:hypothetical protein
VPSRSPSPGVLPEGTRVAIAGAGSASAVRSRTESQPRVWRPCRPGLSPGFAASPVPDRCQPGCVNGGVRVPGGRGHERVHQQVHVAHMAHARITGRPLNLNSPFEWICWHFSPSGPYFLEASGRGPGNFGGHGDGDLRRREGLRGQKHLSSLPVRSASTGREGRGVKKTAQVVRSVPDFPAWRNI